MNFKVHLFATLCAALSACDTDLQLTDNQTGGGDFKTLSISVLTDKYQTKSVNLSNTIPNGHSIGLFMRNVNESDMVQYDIRNVTFTASATESGQDWTPSKTIYLNEALCDVHAYYPYNEDITNIEAIPVESTTQTDYMYAGNTIQVNAENRQATLEMEHALSVITLTIKKGTYTGAGNISKVGLRGSGIAKAAKLNGKTGELADITGADEMLCQDVTMTMDESGQAVHTLFVPNPVTSNVKISLWVDGNEYYVITPGTLFDQGYRYEYTLTVDEGSLDISAVHVGDWGYDQLGNPVLWAGNHRVTLQGDLEQLVFMNAFENGIVSIEAKPFADLWVPTEIIATEGATLTKTIAPNNGAISLRLSEITNDVTVTLSGHAVSLAGDIEKLAFNTEVSEGAVMIETRPLSDLFVPIEVSTTGSAVLSKTIADNGSMTVNLTDISANTTVTITGNLVTFAGDYSDIALINTKEETSLVINAINADGYNIKDVTFEGSVLITQSSVASERTIRLTDIASDVTITFNGVIDNWSDLSDGIYGVRPNGKPYIFDENHIGSPYCIGIALVDSETNQKLMIEKNEFSNSSYKTVPNGGVNRYYYYWVGLETNQTLDSYATSSDAITDFYSGKTNSELLKNVTSGGSSYTSFATIGALLNEFIKTSSDNQGYTDWYIPTCGQFNLIYQNMTNLNRALKAIDGSQINTTNYWTSTVYSADMCWYIKTDQGIVDKSGKGGYCCVRLVRDLY